MPKDPLTCKICGSTHLPKHNRVCRNCRAYWYKYKNRVELIKYLGGCCSECGEDDGRVLDFHHLGNKKFAIGSRMQSSIAYLKREADKCVLLCANCHRRTHLITDSRRQQIIDYYSSKV